MQEIDQLKERIENMGALHLSIINTMLTETEQLKERINELVEQRDHLAMCADAWRQDYDKLKNKYEPEGWAVDYE